MLSFLTPSLFPSAPCLGARNIGWAPCRDPRLGLPACIVSFAPQPANKMKLTQHFLIITCICIWLSRVYLMHASILPRIAVRAHRPGVMMCSALGRLPQFIPPHTYFPFITFASDSNLLASGLL